MATNKRYLKKEIRVICGALAGECIVAASSVPGIDMEAMTNLVYDIADIQSSAIRLITVSFPQGASSFPTAKAYNDARHAYFKAAFRKLKADFNTRIEQVLAQMNALLPAEAKEANKKSVNE